MRKLARGQFLTYAHACMGACRAMQQPLSRPQIAAQNVSLKLAREGFGKLNGNSIVLAWHRAALRVLRPNVTTAPQLASIWRAAGHQKLEPASACACFKVL